ncbi:MAG TPA: hypothetical protein VKA79_00150 [Aestuariivirgaceae bacterium]|nr:hypothetical protein [Aestuariivirgaceae bacterium]
MASKAYRKHREIVAGDQRGAACAATLLPLPSYHAMVAEKLPWIEIADNLPRYLHGKRNASPVS